MQRHHQVAPSHIVAPLPTVTCTASPAPCPFVIQALRSPAWCDRILYRPNVPHCTAACLQYESAPAVPSSDHKPVLAVWEVPTIWLQPPTPSTRPASGWAGGGMSGVAAVMGLAGLGSPWGGGGGGTNHHQPPSGSHAAAAGESGSAVGARSSAGVEGGLRASVGSVGAAVGGTGGGGRTPMVLVMTGVRVKKLPEGWSREAHPTLLLTVRREGKRG